MNFGNFISMINQAYNSYNMMSKYQIKQNVPSLSSRYKNVNKYYSDIVKSFLQKKF